MSYRKVVGILAGSLLTLVPGIPFYKGIATDSAASFSDKIVDKFFGLEGENKEKLKILQLCDSGVRGGANNWLYLL